MSMSIFVLFLVCVGGWIVLNYYTPTLIDKAKKELEASAKARERKKNPPSCRDCRFCEPFTDFGYESHDLDKCKNVRSIWDYAETIRTSESECGKYGNWFEEKT